MSFGNITLMLNKTIQILNCNIGNANSLNLLELSQTKKQVYHDLQKEFDNFVVFHYLIFILTLSS